MNPNRFLNFGAASSGSNSGGSGAPASGSAGGSGNFLFDVIRVSTKNSNSFGLGGHDSSKLTKN